MSYLEPNRSREFYYRFLINKADIDVDINELHRVGSWHLIVTFAICVIDGLFPIVYFVTEIAFVNTEH